MDNVLSSTEAFNIDAQSDFLPGASILLTEYEPGATASAPLTRDYLHQPILNWGLSNNYPQEIILKANKSPELLALLNFVVYFLYGGGLTYEVLDNPNAKRKPVWVEGYDTEIEDWLAATNINDYLLESIIDLVWFNHGFTEMIKNKKGDKVAQLAHQEAAFCRFSKQNTKGYNDTVFINANWPHAFYNDPFTIPVTAINPKDPFLAQQILQSKEKKLMYPTSFPSPGNLTYMSASWHALFHSGHYDISVLIPILKKALLKFSMTIKYIIKVPQAFWEMQARDQGKVWAEMLPGEKKAMKKALNKEMNDFLTGAENAGKSFVTTFGWDKASQKEIPGITIMALEDKLKDGVWLDDGQDASAMTIRALNLTPEVVGHFVGKGMGAGSGSGSRVQGNMVNNLMLSRRDKILSPLRTAGKINRWNERLPGFRFRIKEFQFDTLDKNHSTSNFKPINSNPADDVQPDQ